MFRLVAAAIALSLSSIACAAGAPKGAVLLIGNKGEDTVSFVDLATGKELGRSPTGKMPHEIAISPDGSRPRSSPMAARRSTFSMSRRGPG